jgi:hypothetical protein
MRFVTLVNELSMKDLRAIAEGLVQTTVSDMDFLETLAAEHCFLLPPWVMRANPSGGLTRVCQLSYDIEGNVDKPRVLLEFARAMRMAEIRGMGFGGRFST